MTKYSKIIAITALILIAAASRLLPHPMNFSPVGAMAIFGGVYYTKKWLAFAAPIAALFISDMLLPYGLYDGIAWVYGAFLLSVIVGMTLKSNTNPVSVLVGCVFGAIGFFIITNFGVWLGGTMYPQNVQGLLACYVAALPFFKNSLLGDVCYAFVLFGGYELLKNRIPTIR